MNITKYLLCLILFTGMSFAAGVGTSNFFPNSASGNDLTLDTTSSDNLRLIIGAGASTQARDGHGITQIPAILNDDTFGNGGPSTTNEPNLGYVWKFGNSGNQFLGDVKIVNNSGQDFKITKIHFDYRIEGGTGARNQLELIYLGLNQTMTKLDPNTGDQSVFGNNYKRYYESDKDTNLLSDPNVPTSGVITPDTNYSITRAVGEIVEGQAWLPKDGGSGAWRFKFSDNGSNSGTNASSPKAYIDNIYFEGEFGTLEEAVIERIDWPAADADGNAFSMIEIQDFSPNNYESLGGDANEDANDNGILDEGEDLNDDGILNLGNQTNLAFSKTQGDLSVNIGAFNTSTQGLDGYGVSTEFLSGMNDNTFGDRFIPTTGVSSNNSSWKFGNSGNQFKGDIKLTNNSNKDFKLTQIYFDARNAFTENHVDTLQIITLAGHQLVKGPDTASATSVANYKPLYTGTWIGNETKQVSRSVGEAVEGKAWLAPGNSVILRFVWTHSSEAIDDNKGQVQIDNIAFRGIFVDPPTDPNADDDGDGVPNDQDEFPDNPNETTDTDGDGVGDNGDAFPNDPNKQTAADADPVAISSFETIVSVINDNGFKYTLEGLPTYVYKYGLGVGTYTFKDVPATHPLGIEVSNTDLLSYTGETFAG